jgi:hypothetical protein
MESNDIDIVAAGALVGGLGGLLVGGLGGALVGAAGGALAGAKFKQLKEEQSQQLTHREESRKFDPNPPGSDTSTVQPLPSPTPPVKIITKQFLVLVVSHLQADFLESLKAKRRIDFKDGESLYEVTKYLWLGSETEYSKIEPNIGKYSVAKGAESEYDIYLVSIEINQADEGFNSNVNQLDRFDAFRNLALADLPVNLTISPRLQMEAYGNIGVYSR